MLQNWTTKFFAASVAAALICSGSHAFAKAPPEEKIQINKLAPMFR